MKKLTALFAILAVAVLASQVGSCGGGGGSSDGGPPPLPVPPFTPPAPIDWTTLSPSGDTRTIYVSDSAGDDTQDGLTEPTAKKTIAAGKALLRTGFPDWLLLKAGDTFTDQSIGGWALSGRSVSEPMVVGSYGTGDRPLIQTGTAHGVATTGASVSHVAFVGLHLTPHSYTGTQGSSGMVWLAVSDDILVEDCLFEGFRDGLVVQAFDGPVGSIKDFRIRRSVIVESWASGSFSQGLFAYGIYGLLVEDCLFDHNGWKEGPGGSPPTIFNQNTYVHDCSNVTMRGNLVLRAANLGNKFRSDNTGGSRGMLIEDNVYIEGAVAISCGGNSSSAHRFANIT
ncbi:MAG TPA: hypothetical protein VJU16_02370, partial [Planctomycetota bacterium]|nr:hypothetical protein [Planctomycetota bacterium]